MPHGFMTRVGECVLCVELKLIELEGLKLIDERIERFKGGYATTADIKHVSPGFQIWIVIYFRAGEL